MTSMQGLFPKKELWEHRVRLGDRGTEGGVERGGGWSVGRGVPFSTKGKSREGAFSRKFFYFKS